MELCTEEALRMFSTERLMNELIRRKAHEKLIRKSIMVEYGGSPNYLEWLDSKELYKYAKEGTLILALTNHEADTSYIPRIESILDGTVCIEKVKLSPYLSHNKELHSVPDGYHILTFGGEYKESDYESGINIYIPNWWFLNDGNFETVGNPIKFIPLTEGGLLT